MKEKKIIEISKGKNCTEELEKFAKEGWTVIGGEPIERIIAVKVGYRFVLEREKK